MKHTEKIRNVLKKHRKELLKYPNVVMVGVGNKVKDGRDTGELAIIVGVSVKLPRDNLKAKSLVPVAMKGQKTDVQEVGVIKALAQVDRVRPAVPGYSVGNFAITAGTIGLKVYDSKTNEPLLLSNNHVLANIDAGKEGDAIVQPGPCDGGTIANDTIATLLRWARLTTGAQSCALLKFFRRKVAPRQLLTVDCAVARLLSPDILVDLVAGLVQPTSVIEAQVGMPCQKSGRTTGVTQGAVQAIDVTVQVDYGDAGMLQFEDQVAVTAHSEGGDSGSAILSGNDVIGLLFAGSDTITICNRIQNVFDSLGVGLRQGPALNDILVKVSPDGGATWLDYVPAA